MQRSTREQYPEWCSITHMFLLAPRCHLGTRRGRGNLWEGRCRPDAEFKDLLDGALASPTLPRKPESLQKRLFEIGADDIIFNWQCFFSILTGNKSSRAIENNWKEWKFIFMYNIVCFRPYSLRKGRVEIIVSSEKRNYPNRYCFSCSRTQQITDTVETKTRACVPSNSFRRQSKLYSSHYSKQTTMECWVGKSYVQLLFHFAAFLCWFFFI